MPKARRGWLDQVIIKACILGFLLSPVPALAQAVATPPDFTAIVRQKMPAVVAILTRQMIEQADQDAWEATTLEDLLRRRFGVSAVAEPRGSRGWRSAPGS
jgi:hypothetical protein